MASRPGTPRLLRELNDRSALDLLVSSGPLTRTQIGERTGLSKVTASQLLARLEDRGLVTVVGEQAGGRGPNAALYAVVPSSAYVAGLDVGPNAVTAGIADITGNIAAEITVSPDDADDAVSLVHNAVVKACRSAKVPLARLRALVIGTPGVVDPRSGDVEFIYDLPHWHAGILEALRRDLRMPVTIENDVNLGALAEKECGAARDVDDFALLWAGRGLAGEGHRVGDLGHAGPGRWPGRPGRRGRRTGPGPFPRLRRPDGDGVRTRGGVRGRRGRPVPGRPGHPAGVRRGIGDDRAGPGAGPHLGRTGPRWRRAPDQPHPGGGGPHLPDEAESGAE